jgi:hypothetical protein
MRTLVTTLTLALIWALAAILGRYTFPWVSLSFGGLATILFIVFGIRVVQADPPHKAILIFLGRRLKKVLNEGWQWLPLAPVIFDAIHIKVVKVNQDLPEQIVRTPDYAALAVSVSITWTPGRPDVRLDGEKTTEKEKAEALIEFLNSGEESGVKDIITDVIKDRLRAWAYSWEEGPADWKEAIAARDDAVAVLLKAILGDDLPPIHSDIPTPVLLKYFHKPRLRPLKLEAERWGENWQRLEEELNRLSLDERVKLERAVEERRSIIQKIRQGNGFFYKRALGITINRFTINEILLKGKTADAVEARAKEIYEQEADAIELGNVLRRTQELMQQLKISPEQALEVVQTERKKVTKSIHESKLNISPETRAMLERVFPNLVSIIGRKT